MLVIFPPIFVANTKIIYSYNFVAPLTVIDLIKLVQSDSDKVVKFVYLFD